MFPHLTTRRLGTRGRWADTLTIYPDLCLRSLGHLSTVLSVLCNVLLHRSRYHYYGLAVKDSSPYFNPAITRKDLYSGG